MLSHMEVAPQRRNSWRHYTRTHRQSRQGQLRRRRAPQRSGRRRLWIVRLLAVQLTGWYSGRTWASLPGLAGDGTTDATKTMRRDRRGWPGM